MAYQKKNWLSAGETGATDNNSVLNKANMNDLEDRISNEFSNLNKSDTNILKKCVKCQTYGWTSEITVDMSDTYLGIMQVDANLLVLLWKGNEYVLYQTVYTDNSVTYTTPGGEENIKYEKKFKFNKNVNVGIFKL